MKNAIDEVIKKKSKDEIFGSFNIGSMEVAISINSLQEVVNLPENIIKMPLAPDFLLGVFNLRGDIIPVINLKSLLKFDKNDVEISQKVGIVNHEGAKIGLLFDSTNEILRVNKEMLDNFDYANENSCKVISGVIKLDSGNRLVQVLNPFALVRVENIPQILERQNNGKAKKEVALLQGSRKKCISFSVNGITLGFDISEIHEITKVPEIQDSPIQNEFCMGVVNVRGQTVPVIDMSKLLMVERKVKDEIEDKRIIVLKLEDVLFGLLVDCVESINPYLLNEIMPIPLLSNKRSKMFQGCITLPELGEVLLLNSNEIFSNDEVVEITQGHSKIYKLESRANEKKKISNRETYISFRLDHRFGISIKDVREIINYTDEIISTPGTPATIRGVLNLRGRLITIIDTRGLYEMTTPEKENDDLKILICDDGSERFGLIVDSVESILTIDEDSKMKVPSIMVQNIKDKFGNDIKEIISVKQEDKDSALIVLNMDPVLSRIKGVVAA